MEVLAKDMEAFLAQLVELAGDSSIVQQAVANVNASTAHPTLEILVREILQLKQAAKASSREPAHA